MFALQNGMNHGLSKENLRKFQIKVKFWQLIWMKFANYNGISLMIPIVAKILLMVYIFQDYDYYLIILLLYFVWACYMIEEVLSILALGVVIIYGTALYLRMRFQRITKQFEGISAKNLNSLESLIREHNRVTLMMKDIDSFFCKILGIYYFCSPLIINLLLCIPIYGKFPIFLRSMALMATVSTAIAMYLLSYIPTQVSTEAHRCYNTINSINARNETQLQTKLKVRL